MKTSRTLRAAFLLLAGLVVPEAARAHVGPDLSWVAPDSLWNSPRALELVRQAREVRQSVTTDSTLRSYQADARGFVYFMLDRTDSGERTLVKADQVALEIFWRSPGDTRQRIVGLRDEEVLPTNIHYHLDHLTVVQDEFGDLIRIGDGDEVEAVLHPVAPGADRSYDYRLADSLTLSFAGAREPVRVYEIEVRPRNSRLPGFVGTISLDQATGALVRMNFSFTPASYVDPYLDYIRISLENALWLERHWLPFRQEAELRREVPVLDMLAGTVIRGRFRVRGYRFNDSLPDALFAQRSVLSAPASQRETFDFEEPLFSDLERAGLEPSVELSDVRTRVEELVRDQALSGLAPVRLFWRSVSEGLRFNRAEGLYLGMGTSVLLPNRLRARAHGGWSLGRRAASAELELSADVRAPNTRLSAHYSTPRDLGTHAGASGIVNTLASLGRRDYLDLFFETGVHASHRLGSSAEPHLELQLGLARQERAELVVDEPTNTAFRPVRDIEEGTHGSLAVRATWPAAATGWTTAAVAGAHRLNGRSWGRLDLSLSWTRNPPDGPINLALHTAAGTHIGSRIPPQSLYLLGGRSTLPGHDYRSLVGTQYWLVHGQAGVAVSRPWLELHLGAAGGGVGGLEAPPPGWSGAISPSARGSAWVGFDALWNVVTLDLAHGIGPQGRWEVIFAVSPRFHPWL